MKSKVLLVILLFYGCNSHLHCTNRGPSRKGDSKSRIVNGENRQSFDVRESPPRYTKQTFLSQLVDCAASAA